MQQANEYEGVTSIVLVGYVLFLDPCEDNLYEKPIVGPHYRVGGLGPPISSLV